MNNILQWCLAIGVVQGLFFAYYRKEIFHWHPDPGADKRKELEEKMKILDEAPWQWTYANAFIMFIGVILGWTIMGILAAKYFQRPFFTFHRQLSFSFIDALAFLLAVAGTMGVLPDLIRRFIENIVDTSKIFGKWLNP